MAECRAESSVLYSWSMLVTYSTFSSVYTSVPISEFIPTYFPGVGCHFLLQHVRVKSEIEVAQSRLTLCDPKDCSPPGSSVHGIFQARVLEWVAINFW